MAQRQVIFTNGAASAKTFTYTVEEDCLLVGTEANGASSVISKEPDLTWALYIAPTVSQFFDGMRTTANNNLVGRKIPLSKGEKIYVAFTNIVGTAILYLDPVSAE
jgi:hypothetical protein